MKITAANNYLVKILREVADVVGTPGLPVRFGGATVMAEALPANLEALPQFIV